jgi:hypothetical protein
VLLFSTLEAEEAVEILKVLAEMVAVPMELKILEMLR